MVVEGQGFSLQLEREKSIGTNLAQRHLCRGNSPGKEVFVVRRDGRGGHGGGGPAGVVVEPGHRTAPLELGDDGAGDAAKPVLDRRTFVLVDDGCIAHAEVSESEARQRPDALVGPLFVDLPEQRILRRPRVQRPGESHRVGGVRRAALVPAVGQRSDLGQVGVQGPNGRLVSSLEHRVRDRMVGVDVEGDSQDVANNWNVRERRGIRERASETFFAFGVRVKGRSSERGGLTDDTGDVVRGTALAEPADGLRERRNSGLADDHQRRDRGARPARRHRDSPDDTADLKAVLLELLVERRGGDPQRARRLHLVPARRDAASAGWRRVRGGRASGRRGAGDRAPPRRTADR